MDPAHEVEAPQYAGFWRRLWAYAIDTIIVGIVFSILASIMDISTSTTGPQLVYPDTNPKHLSFILISTLGTWLYFALMESSEKQGTLGKMLLGIIVTDEHGRRLGFARATGRHFAKIISGLIIMIGYLMAGWTKRKQALHDIIAKTLVINK